MCDILSHNVRKFVTPAKLQLVIIRAHNNYPEQQDFRQHCRHLIHSG